MPHGRGPTDSNVRRTLPERASMQATAPPRPVVTKRREPSGAMASPIGFAPGPSMRMRPLRRRVRASITSTAAPCSALTNARLPSRANATARERAATAGRASSLKVRASMMSTSLSSSLVT